MRITEKQLLKQLAYLYEWVGRLKTLSEEQGLPTTEPLQNVSNFITEILEDVAEDRIEE